jgi:5-(carboxyamino)imidazole ribonucleotide mutase
MLSIIQMPPGIPVATVGLNAARNAAILATQMLALSDEDIRNQMLAFKEDLKTKVAKANQELSDIKFAYKTN